MVVQAKLRQIVLRVESALLGQRAAIMWGVSADRSTWQRMEAGQSLTVSLVQYPAFMHEFRCVNAPENTCDAVITFLGD